MSQEKGVLKLMLDKRGVIIANDVRGDMLAIVPRGDRRCRPVGWVETKTLSRLLACGSVVKKGDTYILDTGFRHRETAAKTYGHNDAFADQHRQMELH